jgi:hypothetical protein
VTGEEAIFGIVRRRENIKSLAAQKHSALPSSMTQAAWYQGDIEGEPVDLKKIWRTLILKATLSIPNRKGEKNE